ncbi:MAG: 4-hydroxy-tetrahydrodipicolinate reductase, partial [Clostridia bacterium]|nr:4-hydroxy-tetrahydrodipicolinate reductase [Clostridia bacterium]
VIKLAKENYKGAEIVLGVDAFMNGGEEIPCVASLDEVSVDFDCIVDFSHHSLTEKLLEFAVKRNAPLVLATTGHTPEEKELIYKASEKAPIFYSANMSVGIPLLIELAKKTALLMPDADIEIIEKHHNRKIDAPSGTALMIYDGLKEVREDAMANLGRSGQAKRTKNEIGISAIRMGNIVGEHEVIICTNNQSISLKHEAYSRALFAEGALVASNYMCGKGKGLYDMKSMLKESL